MSSAQTAEWVWEQVPVHTSIEQMDREGMRLIEQVCWPDADGHLVLARTERAALLPVLGKSCAAR